MSEFVAKTRNRESRGTKTPRKTARFSGLWFLWYSSALHAGGPDSGNVKSWEVELALYFRSKMCSATVVGILLLMPASLFPQNNPDTQSNPLNSGIARNQQELQELSKFISENNKEMRNIVGEVIVSLTAAVAGASPSEFGQSPREAVANLLSALQKLQGALETGKNALDGDAWLAISGQLKLVLDLIGEEELPVRFANTLTDLLVKTTQLVSLARQNARLVEAKVQIAKAQAYLLEKAASIQVRRTAAQSSLLPQITALSDLQAKWLLQEYRDRPQVIELAVKTAAARSNLTASQVARGIIVDPQVDVDALARLPGINPDFIKSLRLQFELLQRGDVESVYAAAGLDKYPDKSISIFSTRHLLTFVRRNLKNDRTPATGG